MKYYDSYGETLHMLIAACPPLAAEVRLQLT